MITAEHFFLIKGLVGLAATILYIYHMMTVASELETRGQRMRYLSLLGFAVLVTSSSVGQATTPDFKIHWWNVASLLVTIFLALTALVSIREYKQRNRCMSKNTDAPEEPTPWLNDKAYNVVKFVAQVVLPALGTFYFAVAGIWGLPAAEQVVGTIVAVDTFLGVILGISSAQYAAIVPKHDGVLTVQQFDENNGSIKLDLIDHPAELASKSVATFRVDHEAFANVEEPSSATPGELPSVPPGI